jgi:ERCC4-type nuclease
MQQQSLKIIVDNRERNMDIMDSLSVSGVDLNFAQLPVGDYIISDRICVERKTISDFESSIMDGRLFEQVGRLHESFGKPILIIEGDEAQHRLGDNVILGTILKLYIDYNIQVIASHGPQHTAAILSKVAQREQAAEKREPRLTGLKKAYTTYEWQTLILGSIPGIGPKLAHKMLVHFKTIKGVASADAKELMKVDKIGKKKAEHICSILNAEFQDSL